MKNKIVNTNNCTGRRDLASPLWGKIRTKG
jgi:hypothetical protein